MGKLERAQKKIDKVERKAAAGKISYDKLAKEGSKALKKLANACPHKNTETETIDGVTITYCSDCTAEL